MSTVEQHCEELKKKLEKEGEQKLKALQQKTGLILPEKELVALIQAGADTFKAQMGRNMTYGEMREMYG
jgi:hypothetical protein